MGKAILFLIQNICTHMIKYVKISAIGGIYMQKILCITIFSILEYILITLVTNCINVINYEYATLKYTNFSFSTSKDSPIGLNIIIKIFFPCIYIIILSGILYNLGYNALVKDIYIVTIIYYIIKWFICLIILKRGLLINWKVEIICFILASLLSIFIYSIFITKTTQIFISIEELRDGIWVGIITFFSSVVLKVIYNYSKQNSKMQQKKIKNYITKSYQKLNIKYGHIIKTKSKTLKNLTYAIMIYENYNRPPVVRVLEYMKFFIIGNATLGIMQVSTSNFITNEESVIKGYKMIQDMYKKFNKQKIEERLKKVMFMYNKSNKYVEEVMYIYCILDEIG